MPDPFETGLDPNKVLRRWCELDCTALMDLLCSGNTNPTPEQIALRNHQLFDSNFAMNPACVSACNAAMPEMLSRPFAVNRYFFETDGQKIARQIYDNDHNICGPPPIPDKIPVPLGKPKPMIDPSPPLHPVAHTAPVSQVPDWALPVGILIVAGVAMVLLAPELGVFGFLALA